ncbi:MAG: Transposase [Lactobacillus helveticus]|nr:hypothetical protein [Lactobacillus helveticus]NRO19004.1 hypothetical protein [Lactobacillus helveticus]
MHFVIKLFRVQTLVLTLLVYFSEETSTASTAEAASITLPSGYTKSAIIKWNQTGRASKALINASKKGMKENTYSGAGSDNTLVNVTNLSHSQKVELSRYALSLINSAHHQLGKKSWTYKAGALHFADRVANHTTSLAGMQVTMYLVSSVQLKLLALTQE